MAKSKGLEINFEANKYDYQEYLLKPFKQLVNDLGCFMLSIDPLLETTPAVDKTISRIYRDTRFSKDKTPYKSSMWFSFRRPGRDSKEDPVYFFEISGDRYCYGMGFFSILHC